MESPTSPAPKVSVPFLVYMFGVGLGLVFVLVYAGYASWPLLHTITIGAVAQLVGLRDVTQFGLPDRGSAPLPIIRA